MEDIEEDNQVQVTDFETDFKGFVKAFNTIISRGDSEGNQGISVLKRGHTQEVKEVRESKRVKRTEDRIVLDLNGNQSILLEDDLKQTAMRGVFQLFNAIKNYKNTDKQDNKTSVDAKTMPIKSFMQMLKGNG